MYITAISFLLMVVPAVTFAAPQTFKELIDRAIVMMDLIVPTLIAASLVIYFYGIAQNILQFGEDGKRSEKIRNFYGYGLIVLFVMVSVWGILQLMVNTFFSADNTGALNSGDTSVNLDCAYGACE